jgi:hypothetical protein
VSKTNELGFDDIDGGNGNAHVALDIGGGTELGAAIDIWSRLGSAGNDTNGSSRTSGGEAVIIGSPLVP